MDSLYQKHIKTSGKYDAWLWQFTVVNLFLGKIIKLFLLLNAQIHDTSKGRNCGLFKTDM